MASNVDEELINLLKNCSLKIDARLKGWEYVLGLTVSEEGLNHIIQSEKYIEFILSFINIDSSDKELLNLAYKCLINISNNERGSSALLKSKKTLPEYLLFNICNEKENNIQAKCYILSNLTSHPPINEQIVNSLSNADGLLRSLMKVYCSADPNLRSQYDFLTLVFANVSKLTNGRRLFLQDSDFIKRIFTFTDTTEPEIRRLGAALILRNSCLEIENHKKLLNELFILPAILLPLMDSKEYEEMEMDKLPLSCQYLEESKVRDSSPSVRRILVQALITLCYSEYGWNHLKSHGTYYVVRDLHIWETNEIVKEAIEQLVSYLLVEEYSKPNENNDYNTEAALFIRELQSDIIRDIPDFVI